MHWLDCGCMLSPKVVGLKPVICRARQEAPLSVDSSRLVSCTAIAICAGLPGRCTTSGLPVAPVLTPVKPQVLSAKLAPRSRVRNIRPTELTTQTPGVRGQTSPS